MWKRNFDKKTDSEFSVDTQKHSILYILLHTHARCCCLNLKWRSFRRGSLIFRFIPPRLQTQEINLSGKKNENEMNLIVLLKVFNAPEDYLTAFIF